MKPREVRKGPRSWKRERKCSLRDPVIFLKALEFEVLQGTWHLDCPDIDPDKWKEMMSGWY